VRPVVIVVVLPLPQLLVKQVDVVRDATVVEQLVELLIIDPVRPLDLALQVRGSRTDVDVSDVLRLQMPMKLGLEFGPLSVCTTRTRNGKRRKTSSMKRMAVAWLQASKTLRTRMRVQSSMAVNW